MKALKKVFLIFLLTICLASTGLFSKTIAQEANSIESQAIVPVDITTETPTIPQAAAGEPVPSTSTIQTAPEVTATEAIVPTTSEPTTTDDSTASSTVSDQITIPTANEPVPPSDSASTTSSTVLARIFEGCSKKEGSCLGCKGSTSRGSIQELCCSAAPYNKGCNSN